MAAVTYYAVNALPVNNQLIWKLAHATPKWFTETIFISSYIYDRVGKVAITLLQVIL